MARYEGRISGPLLDRIDLQIEVASLGASELLGAPPGESTSVMRERSSAARAVALTRQGLPNNALGGAAIDTHAALTGDALLFLQKAATKLGWSARATHRVLRVARTIADLAASQDVAATHIAEAIQYRRALPNA